MPLSKKKRAQLLTLCGQLNEDDAVDPRDFFRKKYRSKDSKAQRLCKQVAETLSLVISGECDDDVLRSLQIFSVQPAPNTRRLLVVVEPDEETRANFTPEDVLARIEPLRPFLRTEVARAISRKRAPTLVFEVMWSQERRLQ